MLKMITVMMIAMVKMMVFNDYVVIDDDDDNEELFTNKGREVRTKPKMSLV